MLYGWWPHKLPCLHCAELRPGDHNNQRPDSVSRPVKWAFVNTQRFAYLQVVQALTLMIRFKPGSCRGL